VGITVSSGRGVGETRPVTRDSNSNSSSSSNNNNNNNKTTTTTTQ